MRTASSRVRRLSALLLLALSVGWLLLRRRSGATTITLPPSTHPTLQPPTPDSAEPDVLATDAGLTVEPGTDAPAPLTDDAAPADVLATDAGLTPDPVQTELAVAPEAEQTVAPEVEPTAAADAGLGVVPEPELVVGPEAEHGDPDATMVLPRFVDPAEPPPAGTDDLKVIRGIGPAMERTLHELGITTFQQVAELHGDRLQELRGRLEAFGSRIEREDWVGQARELHRAKYGS